MGRGYIHSDISVGSSAEIAAAMPAEAAWKVWEDPKYEHLGEVHLNHPDPGVFVADCDAQGRPVFTSEEIDRLIESTDADRLQLGHLTGRTWEIALEQLDEANKGIVIPSDTRTAASRRAQPARGRTVAVDAHRRAGSGSLDIGPRAVAARLSDPPIRRLLLRKNLRANLNRWALDEQHAHDPIA